jgi:hypothetical protein
MKPVHLQVQSRILQDRMTHEAVNRGVAQSADESVSVVALAKTVKPVRQQIAEE